MNVLVACEESQRVCAAFRAKGHNAFSCDIQEPSGGHPEWHIQGDVLGILNPHEEIDSFADHYYFIDFVTMDGKRHWLAKWDLIIAHPPCTFMSKAGARWMFRRIYTEYGVRSVIDKERYSKAMEAKEFFMKFLNAECDRICVENPLPLKCVGLPKESQVIQPFYFG